MSTSTAVVCTDPVILDHWHPVAGLEELLTGTTRVVRLLGHQLTIITNDAGGTTVRQDDGRELPTQTDYLMLWVCLGTPNHDLFEIAEFREPDRRNVYAGAFGVHTSAPRAVENFLDMAHFPFVHTNILGIEPYTEVNDYEVHIHPETNDIWATEGVFYQPMAATTSTEGQMSDYVYRVPHPYGVMLYKTTPVDAERMDVIALFCQVERADHIRGHMFLSLLDDENSDAVIRRFQQTIFGQDKPILENQLPHLLPLDPAAETPIRADQSAIVYRRWLRDLGVRYGVIPVQDP